VTTKSQRRGKGTWEETFSGCKFTDRRNKFVFYYMEGDYSWCYYMAREDFEFSHYKEMIKV
jgi:hypothetical protein